MLLLLTACLTASSPSNEALRERHSQTGALLLSIGLQSEPLRGEPAKAAVEYALQQRERLGLPDGASLRWVATQGTRFGASVRLQEHLDGVDVPGAQVVVTLDLESRVVMLSSSVLAWRRAVTDRLISADDAKRRASAAVRGALQGASGKSAASAGLRLFAAGPDAHVGYGVAVPTVDPTENQVVAIDAVTGALLWRQNRVYRAAFDAQVYAVSPGGLDAGVGVMPTVPVSLVRADGGSMVLADAGGHLINDHLVAYNCCPSRNCEADAGPRRATGTLDFSGFPLALNVPICDRVQRATNDPAVHASGDYVYPPIDPPRVVGNGYGPVVQSDPAHGDPFAEVQTFYAANRMYDWVLGLSGGAFRFRDELRSPARRLAVWSNIVVPDLAELDADPAGTCNLSTATCTIKRLTRRGDAYFMPREYFASEEPIADSRLDVDAVLLNQGDTADFAYDGPVMWHELGHGVIESTAALDYGLLALDGRSASFEGSALHEAFADYLAGAFGNRPELGDYLGPRVPALDVVEGVGHPVLRSMENSRRCPDDTWGEAHEDSRYVSAALWAARSGPFAGSDHGKTFDAVFYAALVAMSPATDFGLAAEIISAHVGAAFSSVPDAEAVMQRLFAERGVTRCSKVLDVTELPPRPFFLVSDDFAHTLAAGTLIPGPYQLKLRVPRGVKQVTLSAQNPLQDPRLEVSVLLKAQAPIIFTRAGTALSHDADRAVRASVSAASVRAAQTFDVGCGAESALYVALAAPQAVTLKGLSVTFTPADRCDEPGPDAGAAEPLADAGPMASAPGVPYRGAVEGPASGCQCGGVTGLSGLAALALLFRRRARGRVV